MAATTETLDLDGQRALASVLHGLGAKPAVVSVGRYEIGGQLGHGACGAVYEAHDPKLDRRVAVKVVASKVLTGTQAEARLRREAQALARLGHPNIVEVYDVGVDEIGTGVGARTRRGVYIVMERVAGRTLEAWCEQDRPDTNAIVRAYVEAAKGLAAAHAAGVVHRDFKPTNAMITDRGHVVVLDFGLALAHEPGSSTGTEPESSSDGSSAREPSLTATGVVMGTPRYMAPEQHAAEPATAASDQYAWCTALWEALAGAPPFVGSKLEVVAAAKRRGPPRPPRTIPVALRPVLLRGLAADPAARFESMHALLEAIDREAGRPRRRRALLGLGVATLAAVAWWGRPTPVPAPCTETFDRDALPWRGEARTHIGDRIMQRLPKLPAPALDRIFARTDHFGDAWEATRTELCASHDDPSVDTDAVVACLSRAEMRFAEAAKDLRKGGPDDWPWQAALYGLGSPQRCLGPDAATIFVVDYADPAEVRDVRGRVEGAVMTYDRNADPELAERALQLAEEIDDHALGISALRLQARAATNAREYGKAAELSSLAAWRARGAGDDFLAAEVIPDAVFQLVVHGSPADDIDRLLEAGDEVLDALGRPPELEVRLSDLRGMAYEARGDLDGALREYATNVRRLTEHPYPSSAARYMAAQQRLGQLFLRRGDAWSAWPSLKEALAAGLELPTPLPPAEVAGMHDDLSRAAFVRGDLDAAARHAHDAVDIYDDADDGGWGHGELARGWYGHVLVVRGEVDEGLALQRTAVAQTRARPEGRRPMLLPLLDDLAASLSLSGDHAGAARTLEAAQVVATHRLGMGEQRVASAWAGLSLELTRSGDLEGAERALARAEEVRTWDVGDEGDDAEVDARVPIAHARAWVAAARGDWPAARTAIGEALADRRLYDGTPLSCGDLAELYELLAHVLTAQEDLDGAAAVGRLATARRACADPLRRAGPVEIP